MGGKPGGEGNPVDSEKVVVSGFPMGPQDGHGPATGHVMEDYFVQMISPFP